MGQFQYHLSLSFVEFFQNEINHKVNPIKVLDKDQLFISPGKNPNLSPASTAGLERIILSIFSNSIVSPTATAKKVLPVPAGPDEIIISLCLNALTYSFCFSDLGIIDFLGV